jgi:hypothetical protein
MSNITYICLLSMYLTDEFLHGKISQYNDVNDKYPFIKHLNYFRGDDGNITVSSIGEKWSQLSGEYRIKTYAKGHITVKGANYNANLCPYQNSFDSNTMMSALKHNCDSGIVNKDGSINIEILISLIKENFIYHGKSESFILLKSTMNSCLKDFHERDKHLNNKISWDLPSFATVATAEWDDFYLNYCDLIVDKDNYDDKEREQAVTLDTFLQFYFDPKGLYDRVLRGELPVKY